MTKKFKGILVLSSRFMLAIFLIMTVVHMAVFTKNAEGLPETVAIDSGKIYEISLTGLVSFKMDFS